MKQNQTRYRQQFHIEPPSGWLNDPNGLICANGIYHVYFQHSPVDPNGETPRGWGHYFGKNLLELQYDKDVLVPDIPEDRNGVYSGCAVEADGVIHIFYTGNVKHEGDYDYITEGREANVIHVTTQDGSLMSEKKVVLRNADYPDFCSCHVRDPKVWFENGKWNMVLGARTRTDEGCVLYYSSEDLENWKYEKCDSIPDFGYMWECPDVMTVGGHKYLSVSPQGLESEAYRYQNVYQSGYFSYKPCLCEFKEWDMGFDFYAPQSFEAPDGRRILYGWMGIGDAEYTNATIPLGWQHSLTLPREITVSEDGNLRQNPIKELEHFRVGESRLSDKECKEITLPFDLVADTKNAFQITLSDKLTFLWDGEKALLAFSNQEFGAGRTKRKALLPYCENVRIIADRSSVEIYLHHGSMVFSSRMYPEDDKVQVAVSGLEAVVYQLKK